MRWNAGNDGLTIRLPSSLTLALLAIAVIRTSMVLMVSPPARAAQVLDQKPAGSTKRQWNAVHIMAGRFILLISIFHLIPSLKAIPVFFKFSSWRHSRFPATEFSCLLITTIFFPVCALVALPQMHQITGFLRTTKQPYVRLYGFRSYGPVEDARIKSRANYICRDPGQCGKDMKRHGLMFGSTDHSVRNISKWNGISLGMVI